MSETPDVSAPAAPVHVPRFLMMEYSELNPQFREDPHALLDPQREQRPVEHDGMLPAMLITSHALARETMRNPTMSRNFNDASPMNPVIAPIRRLNEAAEAEFGRHDTMLILDGEDHIRVRGVVSEAFLKRAASARDLIADVIDKEITALEGRESFDVVADYANRIPIRVLGTVLGCPPETHEALRQWTEAGQLAFDPTKSAEQERLALEGRRGILGLFRDLMQQRREQPADDMITDLVVAADKGGQIDDNEILHNLFAVLVAGHLTTADLIGSAIGMLLAHPEAHETVLADPSAIEAAIEEVLRSNPPISFTARFAKTDGQVAGCPYHKGDALVVSLLAANHDPARFKDPHSFDIRRHPNPHMAFGAGVHICMGAPLARMEGQMAVLKLLQRFPSLRPVVDGPLQWRAVPGVRGLTRLEVTAKPA
jgi:cytochrome P450